MIRMVAAGLGSGLLPRSLAVTTHEVVMHPLRDGDARLTTWLTIRREDRSPLIATLQDLVQSAAEELHFSA
ncbi:LysR substrate-binding domain-containing protein [Phenylobacterium sp.]|uniref:LysR substrate-binding domain-containing protein n=1 Tax=Phenylobacterium sp. TaxID=1871053 RepID=UPI003524236A